MTGRRVMVYLATSADEASLFELKKDGTRPVLKRYYQHTFTTEEGLTSILDDMKAEAPARRYGLIVGSHGMGWIQVAATQTAATKGMRFHWDRPAGAADLPRTRFFGGTTAQYQTDITTLSAAIGNIGVHFEYILFDDCYMANIEVAYELRGVTDHLIACPTEIMMYGFPYHKVGQYLFGNIDYARICSEFIGFYKKEEYPYATIGIINCREVEPLAAIMRDINSRFTFNPARLGSVQRLDGYSSIIFFDLGDYVSKLCDDAALLSQFNAQLERTIPAAQQGHTDEFYTAMYDPYPRAISIHAYSGATVSDPSTHKWCSMKAETAWYKATH
jgi:hypothetical protein